MKKILFFFLLVCISAVEMKAQQYDGLLCFNNQTSRLQYGSVTIADISTPKKKYSRNQSFYRHIDLESGNIISLAAFSIAGGLLNMMSDKLCKNAFLITPITAKANDYKLNIENYKWNLVEPEDLFKDIQVGGRLGYHSQHGLFNAGFYASLHYHLNQLQIEDQQQGEYLKHAIHRLMPGISAIFIIGEFAGLSSSSGVRTYFELGLRYAIVTKYTNPYNLNKNDLNNGLVSHVAVYVAPNSRFLLQDIGVFVDINHYDLMKVDNAVSLQLNSFKTWTLGVQFSITQRQANIRGSL